MRTTAPLLFIVALLFLSYTPTSTGALKILMYQIAFGNSHIHFSAAVEDALIDAGHTIVSGEF